MVRFTQLSDSYTSQTRREGGDDSHLRGARKHNFTNLP